MVDRFKPLQARWYAHPNDLIGGWCAMNVDKPPSGADWDKGEGDVADFMDEAVARYIVELHNATLTDCPRLTGSMLGEAVHTALRKGCVYGMPAHRTITEMPDSDWSRAMEWAAETINDVITPGNTHE